MQKKFFWIISVCLLISIVFLVKEATLLTMSDPGHTNKKVVVIDAGHGGEDPGKVGINGALEKDINLQIALKVKKNLENNDIKVVLTRNDDEGLYPADSKHKKVEDLKRRMALIESSKADIAVSIHQNSYPKEAISGAQVFYYEDSSKGKNAAIIMQNQLKEGVDINNKRQAKNNTSYYLLKKSSVVTIIVECGFLSNEKEAELLGREQYQEKLAWNIAMGIMKYINLDEKEKGYKEETIAFSINMVH